VYSRAERERKISRNAGTEAGGNETDETGAGRAPEAPGGT